MHRVIYRSRGGNTKRLADAIAERLGLRAEAVDGRSAPAGAGVLFVGASVYAGDMDAEMRAYLQKLDDACADRAVVFGTGAGKKSMRDQVAAILEPKGIPVEEEAFFCKGSFLLANRGRPNRQDCDEAAAFAEKFVK